MERLILIFSFLIVAYSSLCAQKKKQKAIYTIQEYGYNSNVVLNNEEPKILNNDLLCLCTFDTSETDLVNIKMMRKSIKEAKYPSLKGKDTISYCIISNSQRMELMPILTSSKERTANILKKKYKNYSSEFEPYLKYVLKNNKQPIPVWM